MDSMESLAALISENRWQVYALLFAYCALKSGALPFLAGAAAGYGLLDGALVALFAFAGGYLGDEARFALARRFGLAGLCRVPKLRDWVLRTIPVAERYGSLYIFAYRYPKGMRTIGALPIGLTSMPWARFTSLNAASAALWASLLVGGGYLLGERLVAAVEGGWGMASFALLIVFLGLGWLAYRQVTARMIAPPV